MSSLLSFSEKPDDIVGINNNIYSLIVPRAIAHASDAADAEEIRQSQFVGGISFDLFSPERRGRLAEAVRLGIQDFKSQVEAGDPLERPVDPGVIEKLDEALRLFDRFKSHSED
jgi:hypothetical protein